MQRPRILLIDEVDVFFSKDFYGNVYLPQASLTDPTIEKLIKFIWENRDSNLTLNKVECSDQYKSCCKHFSSWEFLIKEAVKDMLADVKNFKHDYIVSKDKIAYVEQDGIAYNVVYGYKTLFDAYFEN